MKKMILNCSLLLALLACSSQEEARIYGNWTNTVPISENNEDVKGEMIFVEDGRYIVNLIYNGDSAVERINGHFKIDSSRQLLIITAFGQSFEQEILSVSDESLKLKNADGKILEYKRQ